MSPDTNVKRTARIAGLCYFLFLLVSPLGYMYLPTEIVKNGDALRTAQNILSAEHLFRLGIWCDTIGQIFFIFLVMQLYHLFKDVHKKYAQLMVAIVIASIPIAVLSEVFYAGALHVLKNPAYLRECNPGQIHSIALLLTYLREQGLVIAGFLWGLWLFPFGYLMIVSTFMPRVLGYLLIVGGACYIADSSLAVLAPVLRERLTAVLLLPLSVGEIGTIFYLLIKGHKS